MPFGGGDYGHMGMQMIPKTGYQNAGSMFGMMPPNTSMMSGMNTYGGGRGSNHGSQNSSIPSSMLILGLGH
ncbi:hypothetical protein HYPSUDRAFT_1078916 [Hypholoma sublateritium FD-334 SS-4]|uniref:Uncharacterized protein n=1 Tax=Hypholoma sublateritium (strain FD-334 SS-4) TaxID=945553 RepID=A0A0D2N9V7_HYPSF|nr:hypothetical protein HYPSUDRAFT_1078916 [Hypholoma sublateritium FD-334 SS-4]